MKIGTKSLLYGYHCFFIHPLALLCAWVKLYGWPRDWRIYLAFFVHDLGYWGKSDMDGDSGKNHPYFGARLMHTFLGGLPGNPDHREWYNFMLYHSRSLAKADGGKPSKLCYADKLAIIIQPTWLQVLLMSLTGEIHEYMTGRGGTVGAGMTKRQWVEKMKQDLREWFISEGYKFNASNSVISTAEAATKI